MTRSVPAAALTDQAEFVHLIQASFNGGVTYLCTGAANLYWSDQTWTAAGGRLEIGAVQEAGQDQERGVELGLSGVSQDILAALLTHNFRGYPVSIWRAYLDQTTGAVSGTELLISGYQLTSYEVEEQRDPAGKAIGAVTVRTRILGPLSVPRRRGIQANLTSHQHYYPGDTFWQNVGKLADKQVRWGVPTPPKPRGSRPKNIPPTWPGYW